MQPLTQSTAPRNGVAAVQSSSPQQPVKDPGKSPAPTEHTDKQAVPHDHDKDQQQTKQPSGAEPSSR